MPAIKPLAAIAEKFARVTPQRSEDYARGVANPRVDWAEATLAAEAAYKEGVTKAAADGRFGRGVRAAGTAKYKAKATTLGPGRFAEGVSAAGPDFQKGFQPYHAIIGSLSLPPRYPKGDRRNIERVAVVAAALHAAKVGK